MKQKLNTLSTWGTWGTRGTRTTWGTRGTWETWGRLGGLYIVGRWVKSLKNLDLSQLDLLRLAERQLVKAREAETALLVITNTNHTLISLY